MQLVQRVVECVGKSHDLTGAIYAFLALRIVISGSAKIHRRVKNIARFFKGGLHLCSAYEGVGIGEIELSNDIFFSPLRLSAIGYLSAACLKNVKVNSQGFLIISNMVCNIRELKRAISKADCRQAVLIREGRQWVPGFRGIDLQSVVAREDVPRPYCTTDERRSGKAKNQMFG